MRINYFSPLLPAKSGISEVAEQVIPALSQYAEVTVWTDQTEWSAALEHYAKIRPYQWEQMPWDELNHTDLNVYHIGNNPACHYGIWQVSRRCPGLVIVHDSNLHYFFYHIYICEQNNANGYIAEMRRFYGQDGARMAQLFLESKIPIDYMLKYYPLTELAIENSSSVMVHSQGIFQQLDQRQCWSVGYHPLPFHSPPLLSQISADPTSPYRLIIFGHLGGNRRIEPILEALATLPQKDRFSLAIYGQLYAPLSEEGLCQQIDRLGLTALVKFYGYVDDDTLDRALASSHLALNLRYPTMGESSISQLRIWRHALPTLVSQVGWYAEQPEDAVAFVRPDHEITDLQRHLTNFLEHPEQFITLGQKGRKLLETQHSPDRYARAIIECAQATRRDPQALVAVPRPTVTRGSDASTQQDAESDFEHIAISSAWSDQADLSQASVILLRDAIEQLDSHIHQKEQELQSAHNSIEQINSLLQSKVQELQSAYQQIEKWLKEVTALTQEKAMLTQEKAALTQEKAALTQENQQLHALIAQLTDQTARLHVHIAAMESSKFWQLRNTWILLKARLRRILKRGQDG
jgi:glycosyltransferase involved in cell wall biosynthesis